MKTSYLKEDLHENMGEIFQTQKESKTKVVRSRRFIKTIEDCLHMMVC